MSKVQGTKSIYLSISFFLSLTLSLMLFVVNGFDICMNVEILITVCCLFFYYDPNILAVKQPIKT